MKETTKIFMHMSIWTTIIIFIFRCLLGWSDLNLTIINKKVLDGSYSFYGYAGESIAIGATLMLIFNKWAWRWKPLNKVTGELPILAQKYKGVIKFSYCDHDYVIPAKLFITQTYLDVSVRLETNESNSTSMIATICEENAQKKLVYTYMNIPRVELQNRSNIHFGTAMLNINNTENLTGNYYTSRLTRGSMNFSADHKTTV